MQLFNRMQADNFDTVIGLAAARTTFALVVKSTCHRSHKAEDHGKQPPPGRFQARGIWVNTAMPQVTAGRAPTLSYQAPSNGWMEQSRRSLTLMHDRLQPSRVSRQRIHGIHRCPSSTGHQRQYHPHNDKSVHDGFLSSIGSR